MYLGVSTVGSLTIAYQPKREKGNSVFIGSPTYVADGNFRKRDPRFIDRGRYQPEERKNKGLKRVIFLMMKREAAANARYETNA